MNIVNGLFPIIKGLLFSLIGFLIGSILAKGLTSLTGYPMKEPLITLGYIFALIGWLMGVGMWKTWGKEWFGLKFIVHDNSGG